MTYDTTFDLDSVIGVSGTITIGEFDTALLNMLLPSPPPRFSMWAFGHGGRRYWMLYWHNKPQTWRRWWVRGWHGDVVIKPQVESEAAE